MNYAFMSFSCPQATFAEMLGLAAQYGYAGIEPRAGGSQNHGVELEASAQQRASFRAQAAEAGIAICCLAAGARFADPASRDAQVEESLQYIDLAAEIGAPALRVFGGRIPAGISRESAIAGVTNALKRLAERADARGVVVCLETHDDWCNPEDVVAVMERVAHPAIGVNWDVAHPAAPSGLDPGRLLSHAAAMDPPRPYARHVPGRGSPGQYGLRHGGCRSQTGAGTAARRRLRRLSKRRMDRLGAARRSSAAGDCDAARL